MKTKTKLPKCPKGWRRLKRGTKIKAGDKCSNGLFSGWIKTTMRDNSVGWDIKFPPSFIYIRRRKATRKGEK